MHLNSIQKMSWTRHSIVYIHNRSIWCIIGVTFCGQKGHILIGVINEYQARIFIALVIIRGAPRILGGGGPNRLGDMLREARRAEVNSAGGQGLAKGPQNPADFILSEVNSEQSRAVS